MVHCSRDSTEDKYITEDESESKNNTRGGTSANDQD